MTKVVLPIYQCTALTFFLCFFMQSAFVNDTLEREADQERYRSLLHQIRCMACQNQSLAESSAGLAEDLRRVIRQKIISGENNEEIITFLVERYGEFIVYRPRFHRATYLLWFAPIGFLACGILFFLLHIRRHILSDRTSATESTTIKPS